VRHGQVLQPGAWGAPCCRGLHPGQVSGLLLTQHLVSVVDSGMLMFKQSGCTQVLGERHIAEIYLGSK
jgi:hypothetical protein